MNKRYIPHFFILLACLIFAESGRGNQVFYREISLEQLVNMSGIIVMARPGRLFDSKVVINVRGYNRREKNSRIPDFETALWRIEIVHVLKNRDGTDLSGKFADIYPANTRANLELHEKYYREGISKSPIYRSYRSQIRSEAALADEKEFLAFISERGADAKGRPVLEFTCEGGYERASALPAVKKLLAKK